MPGHDETIDFAHSEDPDFHRQLFATGIKVGNVIFACIDGMMVAFMEDNEPEAVNFGTYMQDVIDYAKPSGEPQLVIYDVALARFVQREE